ncbi:MAG: inositol monophosphatase family protein [Anaerolineaceae bacterium]|nr:inositol monophosphatase family protein [Anaerolineaceae bacterium]
MPTNFVSADLQLAFDLMAGCATLTHNVQKAHITSADKADRSPVTIADFAVQAYVAQALGERFPADQMVAEESSNLLHEDDGTLLAAVTSQVKTLLPQAEPKLICDWIDHGQGQPTGRYWVLDPVDGTKGFLRRMQYATALALIEDGEVLMGVLGCPNLPFDGQIGVIAFASLGQGAWWLPYQIQSDPKPLRVSDIKTLSQARILRSYEDSHTDSPCIEIFAHLAGMNVDPLRMDSQAKSFVLAGGQADLMMRLLSPDRLDYSEFIWDQAPGYRVVLEAGGTITDTNGNPLDFSTGRRLTNNQGILATNGWVHEQALRILEQT